jgi:hypothetical protein
MNAAGQGPAEDVPPVCPEFSPAFNRAATLPPDEANQSAIRLIVAHGRMDTPDLDAEALAELNIPQSAGAIRVARAIVEVLRVSGLDEGLALTPEEMLDLCRKHDTLLVIAQGLSRYLRGAERGRMAVLAARAAVQERARTWVRQELTRHPQDSQRHAELYSYLTTIEGMEHRRAAAAAGVEDRIAAATADLVAQLEEARADDELGQVLHELRLGRVPDNEVLLRAARHLKRQLARQDGAAGR